MASSPLSTTGKSSMPWNPSDWLRAMMSSPPPIDTCKNSLSNTHSRLIRSLSFPSDPMVMKITPDKSLPRSLSAMDTTPMPSGSNSAPMVKSASLLTRTTTRSPTLSTYSSLSTTLTKKSPSPCPPGSLTSSKALHLPTMPSIRPLMTSMTGPPSPKSSNTNTTMITAKLKEVRAKLGLVKDMLAASCHRMEAA
jgi:hypothetical protein